MSVIMSGQFLSLADIEGKVSPHQLQVNGSLKQRASALELVQDVTALAACLGGEVIRLDIGEDWAVAREIYPGVRIYFVFNRGDEEFPARLRSLYGGEKISSIKGDELATLTISMANQMVRHVREINPGIKLPEICYKV
jgi:hypothetical protein